MKTSVILDIGFGDSGKGVVTHHICTPTSLVVRYTGGCQSAHNVVYAGTHHTFSQLGSGTFKGCPTYIGGEFLFSPSMLLAEATTLASKTNRKGTDAYLSNVRVHPSALIVTPWHALKNRADEMRRTHKHGSCGVGIGVCRQLSMEHEDLRITAGEYSSSRLGRVLAKLENLREYVERFFLEEYAEFDLHNSMYSNLFTQDYMMEYLGKLRAVAGLAKVCAPTELPWNYDNMVFEGSQGVLLDERIMAPHNTWTDTTAGAALRLSAEMGIHLSDIAFTPVLRTYMTRHGNGPLPTEGNGELVEPDLHNVSHKWAGELRTGAPDFVLWRTALRISNIPSDSELDIVVTHGDQLPNVSLFCNSYSRKIHDGCESVYVLDDGMIKQASTLEEFTPVYSVLHDEKEDFSAPEFFREHLLCPGTHKGTCRVLSFTQ